MASLLDRRTWSQLARAARASARTFRSQRPKRYYLAACLCFKDAARDLAEWLEFHRLVGVEHFYLYNNESTDAYGEVLRPYQDAGLVTLHDWPGVAQQAATYEHCVESYREQARWIAFIDDDEFLFPVAGDDLRSKLVRYEDFAGVAVCRTVFGTSGHEKRPDGLVIESYTRRQRALGTKIKSIVNPLEVRTATVHAFGFLRGAQAVDEKKRVLPGADIAAPSVERLCMNHYFTKSFEDFRRKVERGRATRAEKRVLPDDESWRRDEALRAEVEDLAIQRFVPELKRRLALPPGRAR
jgi:hypothetical protein